jgi:hypothetical protein
VIDLFLQPCMMRRVVMDLTDEMQEFLVQIIDESLPRREVDQCSKPRFLAGFETDRRVSKTFRHSHLSRVQ